ncbi:MAG: 3-deoxy-D-manno-octulosonic acid transferase [Leptothrix ochracea]|uniref:3-deoxy-D-manno-octulosonic acid transferase n=1 Tax=Leptothrix ochracea TaxID=735331 RepID=UPI0034E28501
MILAKSLAETLARGLYSTLMRAVVAPLLPLRLRWRARAEPLYGRFIAERYGFYGADARGPKGAGVKPLRLWLHAVSLGETRAAEPLLRALRQQQPDLQLIVTHGTATGRETGQALLQAGDVQLWLPIDTPGAVRRFLRAWQPQVGVLMETEVWPNLQAESARAGVPVVLANGRLSERSLAKSLRLHALMRPAVASLKAVLAQTEADALRFRQAGAAQVEVLGNLKFDMTPDPALLALGQRWRSHADPKRPLILAASWREGEDAPLLAAWQQLCQRCDAAKRPRPLLVLVPRHPQRFDDVAAMVQATGLSLVRRSRWTEAEADQALATADVWLGDSMREMPAYYALADVALLGGSFAPLGGQNLIEAAACACPVVMGPHTFNFKDAAESAQTAQAARRCVDLPEALDFAFHWASDPPALALARQAATTFAGAHRGAAEHMARQILALSTLKGA